MDSIFISLNSFPYESLVPVFAIILKYKYFFPVGGIAP